MSHLIETIVTVGDRTFHVQIMGVMVRWQKPEDVGKCLSATSWSDWMAPEQVHQQIQTFVEIEDRNKEQSIQTAKDLFKLYGRSYVV